MGRRAPVPGQVEGGGEHSAIRDKSKRWRASVPRLVHSVGLRLSQGKWGAHVNTRPGTRGRIESKNPFSRNSPD